MYLMMVLFLYRICILGIKLYFFLDKEVIEMDASLGSIIEQWRFSDRHGGTEAGNNEILAHRIMDEWEVCKDFRKCSDVASKLATLYPEDSKSWTGTVSERLAYLVDRLIMERNALDDQLTLVYEKQAGEDH